MSAPVPPLNVPDPTLFLNGPRPVQTFAHWTKDGVCDGLIVIYLDDFEHQCFGNVKGASEAVWYSVGAKGREMIERTRVAEQRIADLERGIILGYRAELRSRLADLVAHLPTDGALVYDLAHQADRDDLLKDLGFDS